MVKILIILCFISLLLVAGCAKKEVATTISTASPTESTAADIGTGIDDIDKDLADLDTSELDSLEKDLADLEQLN